jgi:RNA polymerase sigma-70 factor (ECF subfamily)
MSGVLSNIEDCIPALRRYACALLSSPQNADDLVHDTLVRALAKLHTRRSDAEVRPWLFAIMHNLFVSQTRKSRVRSWTGRLDQVDQAALAFQGGLEDGLRWGDLIKALKCLPLEQRTVILLVSIEDLSYAQVSRVLGIPIGTVMSRLSRGRERLRELTEGAETRPCLRRVK